ncbi:MAG: hypothetical protein ABIM50_12630 [Novosphingobium sp.]
MNQMVLAVIGLIAIVGMAYAGLLHQFSQPDEYALLAMVLTGLTAGWFSSRKRPID